MPLIASVLLVSDNEGRPHVMFFFLWLGVSLVISYLGTATLVICLWFLGKIRPLTRILSALAGLALAAASYLPIIYLKWSSSGPDSGPPTDTFVSHLLRDLADPFFGVFVAGGLAAAVLYDTLARRLGKTRSALTPATS